MTGMKIESVVLRSNGDAKRAYLSFDACVAVGYAGRDQDAVRAHIEELRAIGVPVPSTIPSMYWVTPDLVSCTTEITAVGEKTSGEIEVFLARDEVGNMCVTVASDHTDRQLETVSVAKAKQICPKVIGPCFWNVSDIRDHWDALELTCSVRPVTRQGRRHGWALYQQGTLARLLPPEKLFELAGERTGTDVPTGARVALLSGTLPVIGGDIVYGEAFLIELRDPVLGRCIRHEYSVRILPDRN